MATQAANAERIGRAQAVINGHVERISKSIGVAPPPPVSRSDDRSTQAANEADRLATFLELVANHVDPTNAGKGYLGAPVVGGIQDGYNELEELKKAAGVDEDEPTFRGRTLSSFDGIPDDALTNEEGVGEATAADIIKARRKRDRQRVQQPQ